MTSPTQKPSMGALRALLAATAIASGTLAVAGVAEAKQKAVSCDEAIFQLSIVAKQLAPQYRDAAFAVCPEARKPEVVDAYADISLAAAARQANAGLNEVWLNNPGHEVAPPPPMAMPTLAEPEVTEERPAYRPRPKPRPHPPKDDDAYRQAEFAPVPAPSPAPDPKPACTATADNAKNMLRVANAPAKDQLAARVSAGKPSSTCPPANATNPIGKDTADPIAPNSTNPKTNNAENGGNLFTQQSIKPTQQQTEALRSNGLNDHTQGKMTIKK